VSVSGIPWIVSVSMSKVAVRNVPTIPWPVGGSVAGFLIGLLVEIYRSTWPANGALSISFEDGNTSTALPLRAGPSLLSSPPS
jgi:hypothetical protein